MRAVNALSDVIVAVEVGAAVVVGAAVEALAEADAEADADALADALTEGATLLEAAAEELLAAALEEEAAAEELLLAAALEEEAAALEEDAAGVPGISVELSAAKYLGTGISPFITQLSARPASFSRSLVAARLLTTPLRTEPLLTSEGLRADAPLRP